MAISPDLLNVRGLGKVFPNGGAVKTVLKGVDFDLSPHDSLAVVGPSGCGKTTLLLILAGLLPQSEGTVELESEVILRPTRKIALVLQEYGLFPWKTVAANMTLGARLQRIRISERELSLLKKELGIEGLDHLYPHQLSGGQRQRVALARALLLRPLLLLLDEPFAALDTMTRERLQNHLLTLFGHRQFSYIIVTHNIEEAVFLGRRILVLDDRREGIRAVIENPGVGDPDYRQTPPYFQRVLQLREVLKELMPESVESA
jgi:NitT/TauT family transport system ATP-binding protein